MATVPLPERPNLAQLRKRARELQRAVRAGEPAALALARLDTADPGFPLNRAHLAVARRHGFTSWARLKAHVEAIAERTWTYAPAKPDEPPAHRLLRLACLNYEDDTVVDPAAALQVLAEHPNLGASELAVAAVRADVDAVRRLVRDGADVDRATGPYGWSALMYLAYARVPTELRATLATARLLLDAGADPDDGRYFLGYPTPFTVLTGVLGSGEDGPPPHPHALPLARLLLDAGADPNDGQALYNRMFAAEDDFLELLFEFGLGRGDGGPWRRRLPDLTPSPADQLRRLLHWAVLHDQRDRVPLLARNGVDVVSPLPDGPVPGSGTPIEIALRNGHRELAGLLRGLGAADPELLPVDACVGAILAGDAEAVRATPPEVVAELRRARPGLVVWAAALGRIGAVELVVEAGFDIDALSRGDVPVEQRWETALHAAVRYGDAALVRRLLELGADPTVRDHRFDATAAGWAEHFGRSGLALLLAEPAAG